MACEHSLAPSAQAQQHRISELEGQLQEANERLSVVEHACLEAQQQSSELRNELESNAGTLTGKVSCTSASIAATCKDCHGTPMSDCLPCMHDPVATQRHKNMKESIGELCILG